MSQLETPFAIVAQAVEHTPQFDLSVRRLVHVPEQTASEVVGQQVPATKICEERQINPGPAQKYPVGTQRPPHKATSDPVGQQIPSTTTSPTGHSKNLQTPALQNAPGAHLFPHPPQFDPSV